MRGHEESSTTEQQIDDRWLFELAKQDLEHHLAAMGRLQMRVGIVFGFSFAMFALLMRVLREFTQGQALVPLSCIAVAWLCLWLCYRASIWPTGASAARIIRVLHESVSWHRFRDEGLASYYESTKEIRNRQAYRGRLFNLAIFLLMTALISTAIVVFVNPLIRSGVG